MKILILGYLGYIGWPLTLRLLSKGHEVIGIDNNYRVKCVKEMNSISATNIDITSKRLRLCHEIGKCEFHNFDIVDEAYRLGSVIKYHKPNVIVNLAHNPSAPYSQIDRKHANEVLINNTIGMNNLLWFINEHCPDTHMITIGTTGEYCHNSNIDIEEGTFTFKHKNRTSNECIYPRQANSVYHACYDNKTEVLTNDGWKLFKNINKNDKISTLNQNTDTLEYQHPTNLFDYDYNGKLISIKNRSIDINTTPNHNIFTHSLYTSNLQNWRMEKSEDIFNKGRCIRRSVSNWKGKNVYITIPGCEVKINGFHTKMLPEIKIKDEDFIDFFGWWITEGSLYKHYVHISQQKNYNFESIIESFNKLGLNRKVTPNKRKDGIKGFIISHYQLSKYLSQFEKSKDRFIPNELKNLPKHLLKRLLKVMIKGDGHLFENHYKFKASYYTISKQLADDIQEISLKCGYVAVINKIDRNNDGYIEYNISISKNMTTQLIISKSVTNNRQNEIYSKNHYKGKVYCCEVPNSIIYVRRNGKPCWCGNSKIGSTYLIDYLTRLWNLKCTDVMQSVVFGLYTKETEQYQSPTRFDTDECFIEGTSVYTPKGIINIENLHINDIVYTHKGNQKKIKQTIINDYDGLVYKTKLQYNIEFTNTPNHPFLVSLKQKNEMSKPKWHTIEDIYDICNIRKYSKYDNQMNDYHKSIELRQNGLTYKQISKKLNVKYHTIYSWLSKGQKPRIIVNKDKTFKDNIFFTIPIPKEGKDKVSIDISNYINYGIVKDDYVYTPNPSNKKKIWDKKHKIKNILNIDKEFCLLSGYYIAEGSSTGSSINFSFHENEIEYHEDVINIMKSKFDKNVKIITSNSKGVNLTTNSKILRLLFHKMFGNVSHNKQIPLNMMNLPNGHIKELIKGYWRGDGYYTSYRNCEYHVNMTSVSKLLLKQIKSLLLRFGIISTLHKRERNQILSFKGRDDYNFKSLTYDLVITGDSSRTFLKDIADIKNIQYPKRYDFKYKDNNFLYIHINDIEISEYKGKIYNFEIEDDESYMIPVSSHNCFGTVLNRFIVQAMLEQPLTIYGNGYHKRGFLSLNDSIQALEIAINNPAQKGKVQTWNQLTEWHSMNDVAQMIKDVFPNTKMINIDSPRKEFTDTHYYKYVLKKLIALGYKSTRTLKDEIKYVSDVINITPNMKDILMNVIQPQILF